MALGSTNISMRDIFYEIYKRYPNAGEAVNLEALINASNLADKARPHNIGQFANYTHAVKPVVQVDILSTFEEQYYIGVNWRFYFNKPLTTATNIYFKESFQGSTYNGYVTAAVGSTQVIYSTGYDKWDMGYEARIEVSAFSDYDIGLNWLGEIYVHPYDRSSSLV